MQIQALCNEAVALRLRRMIGGPKAQLRLIAPLDPIQAAGEVRLDGCLLHMRQIRQHYQRILIALTDQRLPPGRKEDRDPILRSACDPPYEPLQGTTIRSMLRVGLLMLGEGAIDAAVVATGERAAIEQGQVHRSSYSCIRACTRCEASQGPMVSERSNPAAFSRKREGSGEDASGSVRSSARSCACSSFNSGRSSSALEPKRRRYAIRSNPSACSSDIRT